jgi:tetratricopeptide (TPR) repeat protein
MKTTAMEAGKINGSEKKLYQESIRTAKQSLARETLDAFYRDALDYYHQRQYDEALELLDKIYAIDPYYEDIPTLRETITALKSSQDAKSTRKLVEGYMRQGDEAYRMGQNVRAISFWKQALTVNPSYGPAKKKLQQANHAIAQRQFEQGYLHYQANELEDALNCWSNAIAVDPSFKQRGLLLLMSKVELSLGRNQVQQLAGQAESQYDHRDLVGALTTYESLMALDPRNEEARRMAAKIKIQLGQAAFKSARQELADGRYPQATRDWEAAIRYGYEAQRSQEGIHEVERRMQEESKRKPVKPPAQPATTPTPSPAIPASPPPVPAQPVNPEEAMAHYRQGLAAIKTKDYHRAIEELEIASQLDPTNENIYVARERAKQEWTNSQGSGPTATPTP